MNIVNEKNEEKKRMKVEDPLSFYPVEVLDSVPSEISIDTFEEYANYRAECRGRRV